MLERTIHEIVQCLAEPASRASEAARLATELGAEAFLVLLHDEAVRALVPAPGFPQTVPGGAAWRAFLKGPHTVGSFEVELPFPTTEDVKRAQVLVSNDAVFMLIGGAPRIRVEAFAEAHLLAALLRSEAKHKADAGLVSAAGQAAARATQLAAGLDRARAEVRRKADELAEALRDSDRLNSQLKELNETLEQRVAERTRELEEASEALRQSQKMETVGQLTGGIAHDFNNLLQIVSGNLDLLRQRLPSDAPHLKRYADRAFTGAERAATLTQRLLAFSRRQPLAPKPLDINRLIPGMSELLHRTLGETIEVESVLAPRLWTVEADPNQLENAIINLAINARDAMPEGGKLTIETQNTHLDHSYASQNPEVNPGQYAVICISDTGVGMDAETAAKAVEPFFTTKEVGRGTGLGLSMVYGFVKQSGGHIKIYSEVGEGTTVKMYLPRLLGEHREQLEDQQFGAIEAHGTELILVCEDDEDVRAYSAEVLRELGYKIIEAADGPAALAALQAKPDVDLLFTDVVLPGGMTGAVLAKEAAKLRPGIKTLFTTGYARNAIVHHGRLAPGVELLTKPFSYAELAARVRDILDRP